MEFVYLVCPAWIYTLKKMEYLRPKMELLQCKFLFLYNIISSSVLVVPIYGNPEATRLYNDLLTNYNRLIRPVGNNTDRLTVKMGLSLSQLIEVNLKNQVMTTSFWVEQEWTDYKLKWNPEDYGGVDYLHVPSEHIWLPDIVLYNNADGNYEVTIMTKATVHYTGRVVWKPPAIYKSFCEIDLEYFPFDQQTCLLKFGSWTYDGYKVNLQHISQSPNSDTIDMGIDLHDFYLSVEWDIMSVPAVRHEKYYICCEEPYLDIVFNLTLRRKTLFYTVNLIIPCVGLSFLSVLVFYLPSDSGEKVSLCISVLVSLTVFFLLLAEIIPPTSLTVPLLGKYLLFTMVLVTLSVVVTIAVLNVNFRSPVTHRMRPWVFNFFVRKLPKLLLIERPKKDSDNDSESRFSCCHGDYVEPVDRMFDIDLDYHSASAANHSYKIIDYPKHHHDHDHGGQQSVAAGKSSAAVVDFEPPTFARASVVSPASSSESSLSQQGSSSSSSSSSAAAAVPAVASALANDNQLFNGGHHQHWIVNDADAFNSNSNAMDYMTSEFNGICSYDVKGTYTIEKTVEDAKFIAQHVKNKEKFDSVIEDWKYIAMVLDRLFLWIFSLACILGTALIILQAPSLYDTTTPIDIIYSKMAHRRAVMKMLPNTYTI